MSDIQKIIDKLPEETRADIVDLITSGIKFSTEEILQMSNFLVMGKRDVVYRGIVNRLSFIEQQKRLDELHDKQVSANADNAQVIAERKEKANKIFTALITLGLSMVAAELQKNL